MGCDVSWSRFQSSISFALFCFFLSSLKEAVEDSWSCWKNKNFCNAAHHRCKAAQCWELQCLQRRELAALCCCWPSLRISRALCSTLASNMHRWLSFVELPSINFHPLNFRPQTFIRWPSIHRLSSIELLSVQLSSIDLSSVQHSSTDFCLSNFHFVWRQFYPTS